MTRREKSIFPKMKRWIKDNSRGKLAKSLGYKSASTISNWILRGKIPSHKLDEIERILNGNA